MRCVFGNKDMVFFRYRDVSVKFSFRQVEKPIYDVMSKWRYYIDTTLKLSPHLSSTDNSDKKAKNKFPLAPAAQPCNDHKVTLHIIIRIIDNYFNIALLHYYVCSVL